MLSVYMIPAATSSYCGTQQLFANTGLVKSTKAKTMAKNKEYFICFTTHTRNLSPQAVYVLFSKMAFINLLTVFRSFKHRKGFLSSLSRLDKLTPLIV